MNQGTPYPESEEKDVLVMIEIFLSYRETGGEGNYTLAVFFLMLFF
ncbi:hypothetical protein [Desulfosediminicola flagellatus]|nr:hypothetical protein [Desulfosediminicola flagellatus]